MGVEDYLDDIKKCVLCLKMCRTACPVADESGVETFTPHGKMNLLYYLIKGKLPWDNENVYPFYMCLLCNRVDYYCPLDVDIPKIVKAAREDAVKKGILFDHVKEIQKNILSSNNVYGRSNDERDKLLREISYEEPKDKKILIYTGCKASFEETKIVKNLYKILKEHGLSPSLLGSKEVCCGAPLFDLGLTEEGKKIALKNAEILNQYETVIFVCSNCYKNIKQTYKEFGISVNAKLVHYSEYLFSLLKDEPLQKTDNSSKFIYHDPCKLRDMNIIDEPRFLIQKVAENLIEFNRNKKNSYCCGRGSALDKLDQEIADKITINRLQEAKDLGATVIVSACQTCEIAFKKFSENFGLKVIDLTDILIRNEEQEN